jgi:outer membrane cobalamin receptor
MTEEQARALIEARARVEIEGVACWAHATAGEWSVRHSADLRAARAESRAGWECWERQKRLYVWQIVCLLYAFGLGADHAA